MCVNYALLKKIKYYGLHFYIIFGPATIFSNPGEVKKKKTKILLVDDDKDILEILDYNLAIAGFNVLTANNGIEAIEKAKKELPELIIMDVMMPEMDGIEACERLRGIFGLKETVIVFLTARGEDFSQMAGFAAGGDDYIIKPIKPKLFVEKVKALLRRRLGEQEEEELIFKVGDITVNRNEFKAVRKGNDIRLPKKEFLLLALLASSPNKVFKRKEILDEIWGGDDVGPRTVDVHMTKLRTKIGNQYFETLKGVGYKFVLP